MKQRYILDYDDLLNAGFLTKANSDKLLSGLNTSGAVERLAVCVGGTGNSSFAMGQTVVFDGEKLVSSGYGAGGSSGGSTPVDLSGFYTKSEIDAMFASMAAGGGFPVAYANLTGVPAAGLNIQFLTAADVVLSSSSGSGAMSSPVLYTPSWAVPAGRVIRGVLVSAYGGTTGPNETSPVKIIVSASSGMSSPVAIQSIWALNGTGCFASNSVVPCDSATGKFYWQQLLNPITGTIQIEVYGYLYSQS